MSTPLIAVLGPGGVGGFLASVFWKNGIEVTCVATPKTVASINQSGFRFESKVFGNFISRPKAVERLEDVPDILFITVKATTLEEALQRVDIQKVGKGTVVIPLLNGIEHMDVLRNRYGNQVVAGTISIEAYQPEPGRIIHVSSFARIKIASDDGILFDKLEEIRALLSGCGIEASIGKNEKSILWGKLVRLNTIACVTSITDKPIGVLRDDPVWRNTIRLMLEEGAAVAEKDGASISPEAEMNYIDKINAGQLSSMQRDIKAGLPSEIDAIPGAILRLAKDYNLACPTIEGIFRKLEVKVSG